MSCSERLFVTVHRGRSPRESVPVLATEDQALCREVARVVAQRLQVPVERVEAGVTEEQRDRLVRIRTARELHERRHEELPEAAE